MPYYDIQILDGVGWANGINESGDVVGVTLNSTGDPQATWWLPKTSGGYTITQQWPGELRKVNTAGDAVPARTTAAGDGALLNVLANSVVANLPDGLFALDINDHSTVLGNYALIYDWLSGGRRLR